MKIEPLKIPLLRIVECDVSRRRAMVECLSDKNWEICLYDNGVDFLTQDDYKRVGCVVTGMRLPDLSGFEIEDYLNSRGVHLPMIILYDKHRDDSIKTAKANSKALLVKSIDTAKLVAVVHDFMNEQCQLIKLLELKQRVHFLTQRQRELLDLIASGMESEVIAERLGIGKGTVQNQKRVIFRKLDIQNISEIMGLLRMLSRDE